MVACCESGKENGTRLIKHFSRECKDDWKIESDLVNELGEAERPNILTYCWHGERMYSADFLLFFCLFCFLKCYFLCRVVFFRLLLGETRKKCEYPNKEPNI